MMMDFYKPKSKNFMARTWKRCKSIPKAVGESRLGRLSKSKSWHGGKQVVPEGCFSVYVGPEKQKFAIKTEYANHPLFEMLLEDAETEYGYSCAGPILLPCDVDLFYKVLAEMEIGRRDETVVRGGCGFAHSPLFSPARRLGKSDMTKYCITYIPLTPSRFVQLN
jgi:SAUR family protein